MAGRAVVTGAFSFTGAAVARELRRRGWTIHTLTHRRPPPDAGDVTAAPLRFEFEHLVRELRAADAFVNTYWIRLPRHGRSFDTAVADSRMLVEAARQAKVGRFVQVSVSNADRESRLGYYRGKGLVDEAVRAAGLPHGIVRPTLIVGPSDVLTGNIAWFLRRFPVFPVPGGGRYRLQPVTLDDMGRITADVVEARDDVDVDAAGPETMTFRNYVERVARACGLRRWTVGLPSWLCLAGLRLVDFVTGDVVLTRDELAGLAEEKLVSRKAPLGTESITEWLVAHGPGLGRRYTNDVERHFGAGAGRPILKP
jgi:NADH dehydrogenase